VKSKLKNRNFWNDFINLIYLKYWNENAIGGFGDLLTREITASCNCGYEVLMLFREIGIMLALFGTK